jgi:ribosome biogenesis protein NSA2
MEDDGCIVAFKGKFEVPLPTVRAVSDAEAFKMVKTGKSRKKGWKRILRRY